MTGYTSLLNVGTGSNYDYYDTCITAETFIHDYLVALELLDNAEDSLVTAKG